MSVEWIDTTFIDRNKSTRTMPTVCKYCGSKLKRRDGQRSYVRLQCVGCLAECHHDAGLNAWAWLTSILTTERGQNGRPTD